MSFSTTISNFKKKQQPVSQPKVSYSIDNQLYPIVSDLKNESRSIDPTVLDGALADDIKKLRLVTDQMKTDAEDNVRYGSNDPLADPKKKFPRTPRTITTSRSMKSTISLESPRRSAQKQTLDA
jgi:hypothetical protein